MVRAKVFCKRLGKTSTVIALFAAPTFLVATPPSAIGEPRTWLRETDQETVSAIEADVSDRLSAMHTPGAALAIVKDGKVLDVKCYGFRDFSHLLPVTADTPFCIGTCTTAFTAMAAEMAVDDGSLSLDDHPQKYLPDFRLRDAVATNEVTLREFLSHSSGLSDEADVTRHRVDPAEILKAAADATLTSKPGERYEVSDVGFAVAGLAVAKAENTTYDKLLEQRIFRPLAMSDSRVRTDGGLSVDAKGYVLDRHSQPEQTRVASAATYMPANGVVSSARDMAKWLGVLTNDGVFEGRRFISERAYREMLTPMVDTRPGSAYSLGWDIAYMGGRRFVNRSSTKNGYSASISFLPDQHLGVVLLTNLSQAASIVEWRVPSLILSRLAAGKNAEGVGSLPPKPTDGTIPVKIGH